MDTLSVQEMWELLRQMDLEKEMGYPVAGTQGYIKSIPEKKIKKPKKRKKGKIQTLPDSYYKKMEESNG